MREKTDSILYRNTSYPSICDCSHPARLLDFLSSSLPYSHSYASIFSPLSVLTLLSLSILTFFLQDSGIDQGTLASMLSDHSNSQIMSQVNILSFEMLQTHVCHYNSEKFLKYSPALTQIPCTLNLLQYSIVLHICKQLTYKKAVNSTNLYCNRWCWLNWLSIENGLQVTKFYRIYTNKIKINSRCVIRSEN